MRDVNETLTSSFGTASRLPNSGKTRLGLRTKTSLSPQIAGFARHRVVVGDYYDLIQTL
jgi:hypothetical protein